MQHTLTQNQQCIEQAYQEGMALVNMVECTYDLSSWNKINNNPLSDFLKVMAGDDKANTIHAGRTVKGNREYGYKCLATTALKQNHLPAVYTEGLHHGFLFDVRDADIPIIFVSSSDAYTFYDSRTPDLLKINTKDENANIRDMQAIKNEGYLTIDISDIQDRNNKSRAALNAMWDLPDMKNTAHTCMSEINIHAHIKHPRGILVNLSEYANLPNKFEHTQAARRMLYALTFRGYVYETYGQIISGDLPMFTYDRKQGLVHMPINQEVITDLIKAAAIPTQEQPLIYHPEYLQATLKEIVPAEKKPITLGNKSIHPGQGLGGFARRV